MLSRNQEKERRRRDRMLVERTRMRSSYDDSEKRIFRMMGMSIIAGMLVSLAVIAAIVVLLIHFL